jgi:hypothetical protein
MVPDPETTGMHDGRKGLRRLESNCRAMTDFGLSGVSIQKSRKVYQRRRSKVDPLVNRVAA